MFNPKKLAVGGYIVYGSHGVCKVKKFDTKTIGGKAKDFAVCENTNGMIFLIPIADADKIGARHVATENEARECLDFIMERKPRFDSGPWNRRYREYMELIKVGTLKDNARVFSDLMHRKAATDLSFGERKMLDVTKEMLATEIALALGKSPESVGEVLITCAVGGVDSYKAVKNALKL